MEDIVVPRKEYQGLVANATKYEMICSAIDKWEHSDAEVKPLNSNDVLKYELLIDMIDRWEHGKTGEFKRRFDE